MNNQNIAEINRQAWNKIVKEGRTIHVSQDGLEDKFLNQFIQNLPKGGNVLDLGCGNGLPIGKKLSDSLLKITGVDVSDEMIKEYQKNVPQATTLRIPMSEIDWRNEFDGIISSYSMLCLPPEDFNSVASKISNALKPKGWFFLSLNEGDSALGGVQEVQGQQLYSRGMSEKEIRDIFEPVGLKIMKMGKESGTTKEYGEEHMLMP